MIGSIGNGGFSAKDMAALREQMFKKADADGDGKLMKAEMEAAHPTEKRRGPSIDEMFSQVDTNGDGAIDQSEDAAAAQLRGKGGPPDPAKMAEDLFAAADADGNGIITKEELSGVLPSDGKGPSVDDLFAAADEDSDGAITVDDLTSAMKTTMEKRRSQNREGPPSNDMRLGYDRSGSAVPDDVSYILDSTV